MFPADLFSLGSPLVPVEKEDKQKEDRCSAAFPSGLPMVSTRKRGKSREDRCEAEDENLQNLDPEAQFEAAMRNHGLAPSAKWVPGGVGVPVPGAFFEVFFPSGALSLSPLFGLGGFFLGRKNKKRIPTYPNLSTGGSSLGDGVGSKD